MNTRRLAFALTLAVLAAGVATAERPPQKRDVAELVVSGKVEKIATKIDKFGGDGEMTSYTARVAVAKVVKGDAAKAGDAVEARWFRVTKRPTKPIAGAFGQDHGLKEKDEATFWLVKGRDGWDVIYNSDGVEKKK